MLKMPDTERMLDHVEGLMVDTRKRLYDEEGRNPHDTLHLGVGGVIVDDWEFVAAEKTRM